MPKPSSGCDLCRQRKVGCDFGQPECQRCIRYGVTCPGYRNNRKHLKFVVQVAPTWKEPGGGKGSADEPTAAISNDSSKRRQPRVKAPPDQHIANKSVSQRQSSPIATIGAGRANRLQMLSAFGDHFVPVANDKTFGSIVQYVKNLSLLDLQHPLLQCSIDVLLLAGIGAMYGDQRCLQTSTATYSKALSLLSSEIRHASKDLDRQRMVLSSIMMISFPYHFDVVPIPQQKNNVQDWLIHIRGAEKYLKCCGPSTLKTEMDWLLLHNLRRCITFAGAFDRHAVCFASPEWLDICKDHAQEDESVVFVTVAAQVPGILQRTDELLASQSDSHSIELLCHDILLLRKSFAQWNESTTASATPAPLTPPATEASTDDEQPTSKEVAVAGSAARIGLQAWAWNCELVLLCTLLRIQHFQSQEIAVLAGCNLEEEAAECATKLALNTPSCYRTGDPTIMLLASVNLTLAQAYFEESGMRKELMWSKGYEMFMGNSANMKLIAYAGAAPAHFRAESLEVGKVMAAYTPT